MKTLKILLIMVAALTLPQSSQADPVNNDPLYGVDLKINPPYHNFGHAKIGDPARNNEFTIKNQSDEFEVIIDDIYLSDNPPSLSLNRSKVPNGTVLKPQEEVTVEVSFILASLEEIRDSLIVEATNESQPKCIWSFGAQIIANIDSPVIEIEDIEFPSTQAYTEVTSESYINNLSESGSKKGVSIYSVKFSDNVGEKGSGKTFEIEGLSGISLSNKLVIPLDESHKINITYFSKDTLAHEAKVQLFSDANPALSKEEFKITGKGKETKIQSSYSYGKTKVDPLEYKEVNNEIEYIKSYVHLPPFNDLNEDFNKLWVKNIKLNNYGSKDKKSFFLFVDHSFINLTSDLLNDILIDKSIPKDEEFSLPIYFLPFEKDTFGFEILIETYKYYDIEITVNGYGSYPEVSSNAEIFLKKGSANEEIYDRIEVINSNNLDKGECYLYGINAYDKENISTDWDTYNGSNFKIKDPGNYPFEMFEAGDTFKLDVAYKNNKGADTAFVEFLTDTKDNITVMVWAGTKTGVKYKVSDNSLDIYPNPAGKNQIIKIKPGNELKITQDARLKIIDINGRQIDSFETPVSQPQIRLSSRISPGIYFIILENSGEIIGFEKLIVE